MIFKVQVVCFRINILIKGDVESGKRHLCSPRQSLDPKPFSSEYWDWNHWFLINAVRQHGFPSLFITISPSQWTFPEVLNMY